MTDWPQIERLLQREIETLRQARRQNAGGMDVTAAIFTLTALANIARDMAALPPSKITAAENGPLGPHSKVRK